MRDVWSVPRQLLSLVRPDKARMGPGSALALSWPPSPALSRLATSISIQEEHLTGKESPSEYLMRLFNLSGERKRRYVLCESQSTREPLLGDEGNCSLAMGSADSLGQIRGAVVHRLVVSYAARA